ncbi:MAG: hypothetical protein QOD35_1634 [Nocardioidaceae bacterium]|jgi:uncharacterized protein with FMN-binding domain|nr:hypothetical protein [Nocardioidaceae bacterium]
MRRIILWFASTVSVLVLLFGYHTSTSGVTGATSQTAIVSGVAKSPTGSTGDGGSAASAGGSGSGGSGSRSTSKAATKATKTVTGAVASTQWGPVQVQLTISGKAVTKVAVVQYPNGNPRDAEINSQALPILIQETTSAQSADIDMVSGATVTSTGYLQSLQSALDQAGL